MRNVLRLYLIIIVFAIIILSILSSQLDNALISSPDQSDNSALLDAALNNFNATEHANEQSDLQRLLYLCRNGDAQGDPYTITKWNHLSGKLSEQIYLNTCYPLEISTSQGGRSMGHCSDFLLFVYYAGARLNPQFNEAIHAEKLIRCPNSTFLHGEYPIWAQFGNAARNFWMPNIEQVKLQEESLIPKTSKFLAKTVKTYTILNDYLKDKELDIPVLMTWHSTPDPLYQLENSTRRNFGTFYHGYGHSGLKSTSELIECWKQNPNFPLLTIVGGNNDHDINAPNIRYHTFMNISELRILQWENGIHICASSREGFGHYINEARAMGAMLITTDFGPMNEFLDDGSGVLVRNNGVEHEDHQLFNDVQVKVTTKAICEAVKTALTTKYKTREKMGRIGRLKYLLDYQKMKVSKSELKIDSAQHFIGYSMTTNQVDDFLWNIERKMCAYAQSINASISLN